MGEEYRRSAVEARFREHEIRGSEEGNRSVEIRIGDASAYRGQKGAGWEKRSGSVSTHDVAYCNEATVH